MAAIPTPDLAVPYEAPRQVKTMAQVQPIAPKKGCIIVSNVDLAVEVDVLSSSRATKVTSFGKCRDWTNRVNGAKHANVSFKHLLIGHSVTEKYRQASGTLVGA